MLEKELMLLRLASLQISFVGEQNPRRMATFDALAKELPPFVDRF
jgi:hypothetical protein